MQRGEFSTGWLGVWHEILWQFRAWTNDFFVPCQQIYRMQFLLGTFSVEFSFFFLSGNKYGYCKWTRVSFIHNHITNSRKRWSWFSDVLKLVIYYVKFKLITWSFLPSHILRAQKLFDRFILYMEFRISTFCSSVGLTYKHNRSSGPNYGKWYLHRTCLCNSMNSPPPIPVHPPPPKFSTSHLVVMTCSLLFMHKS